MKITLLEISNMQEFVRSDPTQASEMGPDQSHANENNNHKNIKNKNNTKYTTNNSTTNNKTISTSPSTVLRHAKCSQVDMIVLLWLMLLSVLPSLVLRLFVVRAVVRDGCCCWCSRLLTVLLLRLLLTVLLRVVVIVSSLCYG